MYNLVRNIIRMDLEEQRSVVAQSLRALEQHLGRFVDVLAHRPYWIRLDACTTEREAVARACEAFATIRYRMDDAVQDSPVCLGVIGASADVIACAEQLNEVKARFKAVCAPLQRVRMRVPVRGPEGPTKAIPVLRVILRSLQASDLNVHAAYRKVPVLGAPPRLVTYTRAHTRSVYRKTVDEVATMLMGFEGREADRDRVRLAALAPGERHLALVREHYENIRANVAYLRLDRRGRGRVQVAAELPLLYAHGRTPEGPEVRFPAPAGAATAPPRQQRALQIEPAPFLQTLPVHRYARHDERRGLRR